MNSFISGNEVAQNQKSFNFHLATLDKCVSTCQIRFEQIMKFYEFLVNFITDYLLQK